MIELSSITCAVAVVGTLGILLTLISAFTIMARARISLCFAMAVPGILLIGIAAGTVPAIYSSERLSSVVFVDRDRALELVSSAAEYGVTDFSCLSDCGRMSMHCEKQVSSALYEARQLTLSSQIKRVASKGPDPL